STRHASSRRGMSQTRAPAEPFSARHHARARYLRAFAAMLHIELSTLRETVWRYNLTEQQLYASVLVPWKRGEAIELGEHTWPPEETKIVILAGPHLPPGPLTMG